MPFKLDIFNKEVLANQADYRTVNLLLSGEVEQPDLSPYAPLSALNATNASLNNYLPLSGGRVTGNIELSGSGVARGIIFRTNTGAAIPLSAGSTFGAETGLIAPQLRLTDGRFDLDPDPTFTRAEFRVSNSNTQFNIYNKDAGKYYLRIRSNGGFEAGGTNLNATGNNSHAEGNATTASGVASHTEGDGTIASGNFSHAEGNTTTASGQTSHAEGDSTNASGSASHAEGTNTTASGIASHAEGSGTIASNVTSHAEGQDTIASGASSHAEGQVTTASGNRSHAEGSQTTASGDTSHAAGAYSRAQFDRSWIWRGTTGANTQVSTTRADQFMVSAAGGIALYNRVGVGTDSIANALTVVGDISATGNIYGVVVNALNNFIHTVSSISVQSNKRYGFNTVSGSLTAILPPSPQFGDEIELYDIGGTWNVNSLVVDNNSLQIESYLDKLNCNVQFGYIKLIYTNSFVGWKIVPLSLTLPVVATPDAFITANTLVSTVPFVLQLSGNDNNNTAVTWHWNLTGGSTPDFTTRNVTQTLTYLTTGILPISLTAYNALGNFDIATVSVTANILSAYTPDITIVANVTAGQAPLTVNLTGVNNIIGYPSPVDVWAWNLTGGNTADFNTQTVTYTYSADGTYTVNLTASNSAGFDTATRTITVTSAVVPVLSTDPFSDYVTLLLNFNT